jgi:hypothetical protein
MKRTLILKQNECQLPAVVKSLILFFKGLFIMNKLRLTNK